MHASEKSIPRPDIFRPLGMRGAPTRRMPDEATSVMFVRCIVYLSYSLACLPRLVPSYCSAFLQRNAITNVDSVS